ncbi:hypothetical protein PSPO01_15992 [Paraphaeosphaeria sporulosa]
MEQNQGMIVLLQDLKGRVAQHDRQHIEEVLAQVRYLARPSTPFHTIHSDEPKVANNAADAAVLVAPPRFSDGDDVLVEAGGEAEVSAEVGSNESLDILDEDVLQTEETRATGFVGKSPELQWLKRLRKNMQRSEKGASQIGRAYGPPGDSAEASQWRQEAQ